MENHIEETSSKRDKGFTLVELLIVIVILGILATVTVFAVRGITDKGKDSACNTDAKTLAVAAEAYMAKNGSYPADQQTMVDEGLLRSVTDNFIYDYTAGVDDDPVTAADETVVESYALDGAPGTDCAGFTG